jgi:hypothetical protein
MPGETHVLLQEVTLLQAVSSVTLNNIPQTGYTDLKIIVNARSLASVSGDALYGRFNGSSSGYTNRVLYGESTGQGSFAPSITYAHLGYSTGNNLTANTFGNIEIYIPNYTSTANKIVSVEAVSESNGSAYQSGIQAINGTIWANSESISSIVFTQESAGSFAANSTFSLYGVSKLGTTPTISPKAFGGDIIKTDGTFWYHAFTTSGAFVPQTALTCDILQIAGGGGGGGQGNNNSAGGGGGAGGLRYFDSQSVISTQSVLVGAGGVGVFNASGTNGANSQFGSLTVSTGGGAGGTMGNDGFAGGSGGGAGTNFQSPAKVGGAAFPSGQGNAGGNSTAIAQDSNFNTGGGGGAGGAGGNGSSATGGNGGAGVSTYSAWASATNTGVSGSYAGGGGGPGFTTNGTGSSGGGNGSFSGTPSSAIINTGSGGGGGAYKTPVGIATTGGNGGSGIIIVRYPV